MSRFHHRKLPDYSTLLSGHTPPDEVGFCSDLLQIWRDSESPMHLESEECFIVLRGTIIVEVEGEQFPIGEREFCCFPHGVYHSVIGVHPPVETLMIRAPSINDKVYLE